MKYAVINGFPLSGKDTFVNYCLEEIKNYGLLVSTVDFVKHIAIECGWKKEKTPKDRKFLSDLKKILSNWNDVPYRKVIEEITYFRKDLEYYGVDDNGIVFIMSREPEEINRFKKDLNAKTVLIYRPSASLLQQSNDSDSNIMNYQYDYTIYNDGTLEELRNKAKNFLKII